MGDIKFRAWDNNHKLMYSINNINFNDNYATGVNSGEWYEFDIDNIMQYTGIKDKNGVEIYEYMEIDNTYEVSFLNGSYVLTNISNGDIMLLSNYMENNNGKVEITREYTKV